MLNAFNEPTYVVFNLENQNTTHVLNYLSVIVLNTGNLL